MNSETLVAKNISPYENFLALTIYGAYKEIWVAV